ncbi:ABC transporter permease [Butyrivibrio sp. INlla16]|uniref:ABC transporter permease n=1 Tax=Butyrivibrio sp. INlla16 TaxID=1520807 RepID=UPI00088A4D65|nr:ABC transporter permease [Butyrivibrio sp. INlla16]SDB03530.1 putative ABC transport system permease protein [Butyrivibrio sp. INlla16]
MDTFIEYLESAIKNILGNKMRTALTMLGIIIGIASVIAALTIGNGMARYVGNEVDAIGGNVADIYLDMSVADRGFNNDDIREIKDNFPGVSATFYDNEYGISSGPRGAYDTLITAAGSDYQKSTLTKLETGTYFTDDQVDQGARVCVMMKNDAVRLFGTADALGKTFELSVGGSSIELEVIGIRENWSEMISKMIDMETDSYTAMIEMPLTTYARAFGKDISEFHSVEIYWDNTQPGTIVKSIVRFVENRLGLRGQDAVYYMSMSDVSGQVDSIMGAITAFISLVAAISLLVGGIGVMNIMLVTVTERTREIGIRKSIGARTKAILFQFLAESAIISLMGGIVGVIVGIAGAYVGCILLDLEPVIDFKIVIGATLFSMMIGIFFGIYPARKAAKLKPIDALARN